MIYVALFVLLSIWIISPTFKNGKFSIQKFSSRRWLITLSFIFIATYSTAIIYGSYLSHESFVHCPKEHLANTGLGSYCTSPSGYNAFEEFFEYNFGGVFDGVWLLFLWPIVCIFALISFVLDLRSLGFREAGLSSSSFRVFISTLLVILLFSVRNPQLYSGFFD